MADKSKAALKRPPPQKPAGKKGFSKAHKYTWEESAKKVVEIYEEVLDKAKSRES
jgi:hypothetical protein